MRVLLIGLGLLLGLYTLMLLLHTASVAVRGVGTTFAWVILRLALIVCSALGSYWLLVRAGVLP